MSSFWKKFKNIAGYALTPFTAGTSLAMTNAAKNLWDDLTGKTAQKKANAANLAEAERNRIFNAEEAQKNRDWQEQMSNTAITRQVQDLNNSGINPLLAAQLGGAAVGSGSTASGTPGTVSPEPSDMQGVLGLANTAASVAGGFSAVGAGINQMAQAAKTSAETPFIPKQQQANIANTTADTVQKQAQTQNINANTQKTNAETENIKQQFSLLSIQEQKETIELAKAYINAENEKERARLNNEFMKTKFGQYVSKYLGGTLKEAGQLLVPLALK